MLLFSTHPSPSPFLTLSRKTVTPGVATKMVLPLYSICIGLCVSDWLSVNDDSGDTDPHTLTLGNLVKKFWRMLLKGVQQSLIRLVRCCCYVMAKCFHAVLKFHFHKNRKKSGKKNQKTGSRPSIQPMRGISLIQLYGREAMKKRELDFF